MTAEDYIVEDYSLLTGLLDGMKPTARLTVSEWAQLYRELDSKAAAEHGAWRNERTPFLVGIMDKLSATDPHQKIVFKKGSQIGATEAGCNWIGYTIDIAGKSMLCAMPNEDMAEKFSKMRVQPMIDACESLQKKVASKKDRDGGNTILFKEHVSGILALTGANSPASTKSLPIPYVYLDEVDEYKADIGGQGDSISLFLRATRTFADRKIFLTSTPTIEGESIIEREFLETNQAYYHIPCPDCGGLQKLNFEQFRWKPKRYKEKDIHYECVHCGHYIQEKEKEQFLPSGQWISDFPEREDGITYGCHLNSLYSPYGWFSWGEICEMYDKAQGNDERMKVFYNTVLGKTWAEIGDAPDWKRLHDRRETYNMGTVNAKTSFITCGVDVQRDRLELQIIGWGIGKESWSVDYQVLLGKPSEDKVWKELDKIIGGTWKRDDGAEMRLHLTAIDSSYETQYVYAYCQRHDPTRVIPVRGQDALRAIVAPPKQVHVTAAGKKIGGLKLWNIGVSLMKSELYGWLNGRIEDDEVPEGYCHFPEYDETFFRGLTSEVLRKKKVRGNGEAYEWVKIYKRNEPLDTWIYARVCANIVGVDRMMEEHWQVLHNSYFVKRDPGPKPKRKSFWD